MSETFTYQSKFYTPVSCPSLLEALKSAPFDIKQIKINKNEINSIVVEQGKTLYIILSSNLSNKYIDTNNKKYVFYSGDFVTDQSIKIKRLSIQLDCTDIVKALDVCYRTASNSSSSTSIKISSSSATVTNKSSKIKKLEQDIESNIAAIEKQQKQSKSSDVINFKQLQDTTNKAIDTLKTISQLPIVDQSPYGELIQQKVSELQSSQLIEKSLELKKYELDIENKKQENVQSLIQLEQARELHKQRVQNGWTISIALISLFTGLMWYYKVDKVLYFFVRFLENVKPTPTTVVVQPQQGWMTWIASFYYSAPEPQPIPTDMGSILFQFFSMVLGNIYTGTLSTLLFTLESVCGTAISIIEIFPAAAGAIGFILSLSFMILIYKLITLEYISVPFLTTASFGSNPFGPTQSLPPRLTATKQLKQASDFTVEEIMQFFF